MRLYETVDRAMVMLERGKDTRTREEISRSLSDSIDELDAGQIELQQQGFPETAKLVGEIYKMLNRASQQEGKRAADTMETAFDRAFMAMETLRREADGKAPAGFKQLLQDVRYDLSSLLTDDPGPTYGQSTIKWQGGGSFSSTF